VSRGSDGLGNLKGIPTPTAPRSPAQAILRGLFVDALAGIAYRGGNKDG
jgi:hypothetical protein